MEREWVSSHETPSISPPTTSPHRARPCHTDEDPTSSSIEIGPSVSSRDFISSFSPEDFDGAEKRTIELKLGQREVSFNGRDITGFVLPNVCFHVTTAYNILRANGVLLGKRDFLDES